MIISKYNIFWQPVLEILDKIQMYHNTDIPVYPLTILVDGVKLLHPIDYTITSLNLPLNNKVLITFKGKNLYDGSKISVNYISSESSTMCSFEFILIKD